MKKNGIVIILFFTSLFISAQEYKLVWEDNFDKPVLNEEFHWNIEVNGNGGGNNELQYYRRENISLEKHESGVNCMVINARLEDFSGKKATSARLNTFGKVSFRYGKIEARIKLPKTANGLWPAFWMMGEDFSTVGWPKCGEIDILEMGNSNGIKNGTQDKYFNGACHWGESWNGGSYPNYAKAITNSYGIQDDFHLFTLIWDDKSVKTYLDLDKYPNNTPYFEMNISGEDVAGSPRRYFHKPFSILLNLAVGGNFTGITGNSNIAKITALPADGSNAKMYIDYVRIYQKGVEGELYKGPELNSGTNEPEINTEIYPNPVKDFIIIEEYKKVIELKIFSVNGQFIENISNTEYKINLSHLKSGLYVIGITFDDKTEKKFRIIKE